MSSENCPFCPFVEGVCPPLEVKNVSAHIIGLRAFVTLKSVLFLNRCPLLKGYLIRARFRYGSSNCL